MNPLPTGRLVFMLAMCGCAHAQQPGRAGDGQIAAAMVALAESCYQADALLRRTCARAGALPRPEVNGQLCELPPDTLESRTARNLAEFKSTWQAELGANAAELEKSRSELRETFEAHYGKLRAGGGFSMMDLQSLRRQVDECVRTVPRIVGPRKPR